MKNNRVLISGASIAGPALAYWLNRYGFQVTVVEKAGCIRSGGQPVDFKGPIHLAVLRKMGLLDAIRQASVPNKDGSSSTPKGAKSASCLSALLAVISTFRAGGNYELAFAEYANKYRRYASISQSLNVGRLLAPATRLGIRARNLLFLTLSMVGPLMKLVDRPAANLKLENHDRDISPGQYQPQRMSGLTAIFETQTNSVRLKSQSALRAAERASPCQAVP